MFWKLDALSNEEVVAGLHRALGANRRLTAEVVAHLGEVEERRLHLDAACGSMFSYCVTRLGFSEDEACRRIDVARLARRFPAIFPRLASGELSLSVAALLKPHLSNENADPLLAAVSGKSVQLAREALAEMFPRPDVPTTVRKLPDPRTKLEDCGLLPLPGVATDSFTSIGAAAASIPLPLAEQAADGRVTRAQTPPGAAGQPADGLRRVATATPMDSTSSRSQPQPRAIPCARPIEPLSASRYKVQFTADADLKAKLELARDLMRHAVPSGDLAVIIGAALDRLIAEVMKGRFGARSRQTPPCAARSSGGADASSATPTASGDLFQPPTTCEAGRPVDVDRSSDGAVPQRAEPTTSPATGIPRAVRRAVVERDGLRCSWVDAGGTRCEDRAWLEYDHRHPRGKGGSSGAENVRLLCRGHNQRAAELEYGRQHVQRAILDDRRRRRVRHADDPRPGS